METNKEPYVAPKMELMDLEVSTSIMSASDMSGVGMGGEDIHDTDSKDFWGD